MSYAPFRHLLERRAGGVLWLRVQTVAVLMLSFLVGILSSHFMLKAGVTQLIVRLPLTVFVSYAVFLLLVRVWMWLSGVERLRVKVDPNYQEADHDVASQTSIGKIIEKTGDLTEGVGRIADMAPLAEAEGCLPFVAAILITGLVFVVLTTLWWFFGGFVGAASAAMLEAGVEALLAVGMARAAGGNAASWLAGALRVSWKYWLGLGMAASLLGAVVNYWQPGAATLYQAFFKS